MDLQWDACPLKSAFFLTKTVDQLHDSYRHTGPITFVRYRGESTDIINWQPFSNGITGDPVGARRLLKHVVGNQVVFEEANERLGLIFRYSWRTSAQFGFVRTASLENVGSREIDFEFVDGLQNICPSDVPLATYQRASCLVDAYKYNELDSSTGMGIYSLTSQILDRAEAAEALKATTVWCHGLPDAVVFLSSEIFHAFKRGVTPVSKPLCTGQRANYFVFSPMKLAPGQSRSWYLAADVSRDHQQVAWIRKQLLEDNSIDAALEAAIHADHHELLLNVASSDGLEATGGKLASAHHFANVLFNNMRGGVPAANYLVETQDFLDFVSLRNCTVVGAGLPFLHSLPELIESHQMLALAEKHSNRDLVRLAMEYLPLTFGRRHGDPSRPWNTFEIKVRHNDGSKIYNYQGNWRDIFQNWEALCSSFPAFLPSIVAKFVNASTVDGFNPYRITSDGIDWEKPDPEDPWSNIGYWGDHQIVYLSRLLEALHNYYPGELNRLLEEQMFCYANVPYRINSYDEIVANNSETITYDQVYGQGNRPPCRRNRNRREVGVRLTRQGLLRQSRRKVACSRSR